MTNIDSLLFKIDINKCNPHLGALLISEPFLREEYFCHSVICLVDYEKGKSSMGIVMNKPTEYTLCSLIPDIEENAAVRIYCGGPLSCDRLYFIHTLGEIIPNSKKIINGLYIGGDFNTMIEYINSGGEIEGKVRFFIGYSGWDAGQLEEELNQHVWAIGKVNNNNELLIGDSDKYWHQYVKHLGKEYRGWRFHPENVLMN